MAGADHNRWLNMGSEMISYPKKVRVKGDEGSATPFTRIIT